jgi:hypothetical protein
MNVYVKENEVNCASTVHPEGENIFVYINFNIAPLKDRSFSYNTHI